jgi:ADP-ribose pyrophosphatase YjhB (NUDIX family)
LRLRHLVARAVQAYWRLRRGLSLGAEACIVDTSGRVLLVNDTRLGRWSLPATAVRQGETLEAALTRCLEDVGRIELATRPHLYWIFTERRPSPFQKTGLFVVRNWNGQIPASETARFFASDVLPEKIGAASALRVKQALDDRAPAEVC